MINSKSTQTKKITLLVVDDNKDFRDMMENYISKTDDISIVGTAGDGLIALEKIVELQPDIVTLDLIMPALDGIGVLEKLKGMRLLKKPLIIVLSALGQDMLIRKAMAYGIEYYLVKPLEINNLVKRIREVADDMLGFNESEDTSLTEKQENDTFTAVRRVSKSDDRHVFNMELEVTSMLYEAGVPPHMAGYRYLKEAIMYTVTTLKPFTSKTKELYPAIAQMFSTTPNKVERAIRACIEKAWLRTTQDNVDSLFGYTITNTKTKPTNSEFIAMMAERIKIMQKG